ncbi:hypothetical protein [Streptomyces himalayensis]|uniref:Uncharacterized protein n=1 Tax=Streptomyces himalayensis subsp. himalayensis TaxID=2756131 RepID=A0A7W0DQQ3_9ACTN|nr:hypothetical protein [Streptomyces himalayensis]MBA2949018.1 hypothetical protein [Streptomyces himalayensis subsp. himalayensis]
MSQSTNPGLPRHKETATAPASGPVTRAYRAAALAVGTALLATACTGQQAATKEPDNGTSTALGSSADAPKDYPLDAYMPTTAERQALDHAINILARSCMKKFGLSWPAYQPPPGNLPQNGRKYGVTDLKSVRIYGYKPPLPDGVTKQQAVSYQEKAKANEETITPAAQAAYTGSEQAAGTGKGSPAQPPSGVPEGGCQGEAIRKAGADRLNQDMTAVQKLFFEASAATREDPGTNELDQRWSACMRKAGMNYPDPLAAVDDPTWRTQKTKKDGPAPNFPAPSQKEIRTAEADVICKSETGYVHKRYAIDSRLQRQLIEKHADMLAAVKERKQRMTKQVHSVATGHSAVPDDGGTQG